MLAFAIASGVTNLAIVGYTAARVAITSDKYHRSPSYGLPNIKNSYWEFTSETFFTPGLITACKLVNKVKKTFGKRIPKTVPACPAGSELKRILRNQIIIGFGNPSPNHSHGSLGSSRDSASDLIVAVAELLCDKGLIDSYYEISPNKTRAANRANRRTSPRYECMSRIFDESRDIGKALVEDPLEYLPNHKVGNSRQLLIAVDVFNHADADAWLEFGHPVITYGTQAVTMGHIAAGERIQDMDRHGVLTTSINGGERYREKLYNTSQGTGYVVKRSRRGRINVMVESVTDPMDPTKAITIFVPLNCVNVTDTPFRFGRSPGTPTNYLRRFTPTTIETGAKTKPVLAFRLHGEGVAICRENFPTTTFVPEVMFSNMLPIVKAHLAKEGAGHVSAGVIRAVIVAAGKYNGKSLVYTKDAVARMVNQDVVDALVHMTCDEYTRALPIMNKPSPATKYLDKIIIGLDGEPYVQQKVEGTNKFVTVPVPDDHVYSKSVQSYVASFDRTTGRPQDLTLAWEAVYPTLGVDEIFGLEEGRVYDYDEFQAALEREEQNERIQAYVVDGVLEEPL